MQEVWRPTLGATYLGDGRCEFRVWAPFVQQVEIEFLKDRRVPMTLGDMGYHEATVEGVEPGSLYLYRLDGQDARPDPASRHQPEGVHGPSQVVEHRLSGVAEGWSGPSLEDSLFYELHVGTFTPEGTFDAVIPHLDRLRDLGVTAIEIMPVAQFPGTRNWGYDGALPFAVQNSYGGPEGLRRLVRACHERGLAVVLDVVYNHLGPEGNYLSQFGPYFTERYRTPWGLALNFDGPDSDPVRRYFIENALYWVAEYGIDALRLDAVHAIADASERPFLQELATELHALGDRLGRRVYGIAESDLNTLGFLRSPERGGCGLDAQWTDDFHHALHTLLTGEKRGYYHDFGGLGQLAKSFQEGFIYTGQYSPYRRRRHGVPAAEMAGYRHVVCSQNHDQTGNRMSGERLTALVSFESLKLAAGAVLLSPFLPLLFMGEEYGEPAPFQYFVSHSDEDLIAAVREGRQEEFASFGWNEEPPDPQAEDTFARCRLDPSLREREPHRTLEAFYRELIRLRRSLPALQTLSKENVEATALEQERVLLVRRWENGSEILVALGFGPEEGEGAPLPLPEGRWRKLLDSSAERWRGPGTLVPETVSLPGEALPRLAGRGVVVFERA
ncbi:MAG TPA: malto-oligosyltrehalose trehalohydrolase [Thermoanaerobaculia bacterium]|nr:malto-oligosyltrehalose trehalohydrolase [Thermoanaerobaculia bacterium]